MNVRVGKPPVVPKVGLGKVGAPKLRTLKRMLTKPTGGGATGGGGFIAARPTGG